MKNLSKELSRLYSNLESREDSKVDSALEEIKSKPTFLEAAEKRYLGFIKARLNDRNATLSDFKRVTLSKKEEDFLLSESVLGKCEPDKLKYSNEVLSFQMKGEEESKLIVDFLGGMVYNHIDMNQFLDECVIAEVIDYPSSTLSKFVERTIWGIFKDINEEAKIYPNGWYGKILSHFSKAKIGRVLFDQTSFEESNYCLVIREFMLGINMFRSIDKRFKKGIYFEISKSTTPNLTEIFWLTSKQHHVVWRDTTMTMPRVRLNYSRTNVVQINDERKKKIESDLISLENFYEIAFEGFEYYWKKKYKNAYVKFQEVIDIIPLYHIFLIAAECAAKLKKVDEAIALNHKAMELNPKEYDPIYSNALIYKKLENDEEVYSCLKQAVKLFKYDPIVSEFYKNSEDTNYSSTQNNIFKLAMNVRSKDDCFQLLKELLQTGIVPHNFLEKKMMKFLNIKYFVFVFTLPEVKGIHVKRELKVTDAIADCPYYFANSKERGYKQVEFKDETPVSKKDAKIGFNLARKMLNKEILPARDNPLFGAIFRSDDDYDSILGFVPGYDMEKAQKTIEKQNFHVLRWDEFWNGVVDDVIIKKIMNE